jgi:hypothetical protein
MTAPSCTDSGLVALNLDDAVRTDPANTDVQREMYLVHHHTFRRLSLLACMPWLQVATDRCQRCTPSSQRCTCVPSTQRAQVVTSLHDSKDTVPSIKSQPFTM